MCKKIQKNIFQRLKKKNNKIQLRQSRNYKQQTRRKKT